MKTRYASKRKQQQQARKKRNFILGGIILSAVLVVVLFIALGGQKPSAGGAVITPEPHTWPDASGKSLGPADAKVVLVEYADFQCPYCRIYHETILPRLLSDYIATGKIRYEYRHFIVIDNNVGGSESRHAAQATQCALEQNRFWDYYALLFANQGSEGSGAFSDARLKLFAQTLGLDTSAFNSCLGSSRAASQVRADEQLAASDQIRATPSLLINGKLVDNPLDYAALQAAIDAALAAK